MGKQGQHYRARKAIEWKFVRGWTNKKIAEELEVAPRTVSEYINHPPEELQEPIQHFKDQLTMGTFERLREQLAEAEQRARNAESPEKVYEYDDEGNLKTEYIEFEGGGGKYIPKVKGLEMKPDHKVKAMARQEERRIIQMLWDLAGVEAPEQREVEHSGDGITIVYESDDED